MCENVLKSKQQTLAWIKSSMQLLAKHCHQRFKLAKLGRQNSQLFRRLCFLDFLCMGQSVTSTAAASLNLRANLCTDNFVRACFGHQSSRSASKRRRRRSRPSLHPHPPGRSQTGALERRLTSAWPQLPGRRAQLGLPSPRCERQQRRAWPCKARSCESWPSTAAKTASQSPRQRNRH